MQAQELAEKRTVTFDNMYSVSSNAVAQKLAQYQPIEFLDKADVVASSYTTIENWGVIKNGVCRLNVRFQGNGTLPNSVQIATLDSDFVSAKGFTFYAYEYFSQQTLLITCNAVGNIYVWWNDHPALRYDFFVSLVYLK